MFSSQREEVEERQFVLFDSVHLYVDSNKPRKFTTRRRIMAKHQNQGIKIVFLILLSLLTAFCIAALGVFIWLVTDVHACKKYVEGVLTCPDWWNSWLAIWIVFIVFLFTTVILGWIWECTECGGTCLGIIFVIMAVIFTAAAIALLALFGMVRGGKNWVADLSIGIIGMILGIGTVVVGILGLCIEKGN